MGRDRSAITNQDMLDVFAEIASAITRNDIEDPSVSIAVPQAGHLYVNGVARRTVT